MILLDSTGTIAHGYLLLALICIIVMGAAGIAHIIRGIATHPDPPAEESSSFGKRAIRNAPYKQSEIGVTNEK